MFDIFKKLFTTTKKPRKLTPLNSSWASNITTLCTVFIDEGDFVTYYDGVFYGSKDHKLVKWLLNRHVHFKAVVVTAYADENNNVEIVAQTKTFETLGYNLNLAVF